jgi:vacuolar-type H+-ATPase subunit I/STV1
MDLLKRLEQTDAHQPTTETLETSETLTSVLSDVEQHLKKLTKTVKKLAGHVKTTNKIHATDLEILKESTSRLQELPSTLSLPDEVTERLSEIEKTLVSVAKQLSVSEAVKLPDGSNVKRSDLDAYTMMHQLSNQIRQMISASAELQDVVRKRGVIRVDTDKLKEQAVSALDDRLAKAVEEPISRIETRLKSLEEQTAELGTERLATVGQEVTHIVDKAEAVASTISHVEDRIDKLNARVTWTTVGRLCLALVPLAAVILVVGGLLMGTFHAVGIGPLLGWAWAAFESTEPWWGKALIAVGTLAGIGLFGWVVHKLAGILSDEYARW